MLELLGKGADVKKADKVMITDTRIYTRTYLLTWGSRMSRTDTASQMAGTDSIHYHFFIVVNVVNVVNVVVVLVVGGGGGGGGGFVVTVAVII